MRLLCALARNSALVRVVCPDNDATCARASVLDGAMREGASAEMIVFFFKHLFFSEKSLVIYYEISEIRLGTG